MVQFMAMLKTTPRPPPLVEKKACIAGKTNWAFAVKFVGGGDMGNILSNKNYYLNLFLLSLGLSVEDLALVSCNT